MQAWYLLIRKYQYWWLLSNNFHFYLPFSFEMVTKVNDLSFPFLILARWSCKWNSLNINAHMSSFFHTFLNILYFFNFFLYYCLHISAHKGFYKWIIIYYTFLLLLFLKIARILLIFLTKNIILYLFMNFFYTISWISYWKKVTFA